MWMFVRGFRVHLDVFSQNFRKYCIFRHALSRKSPPPPMSRLKSSSISFLPAGATRERDPFITSNAMQNCHYQNPYALSVCVPGGFTIKIISSQYMYQNNQIIVTNKPFLLTPNHFYYPNPEIRAMENPPVLALAKKIDPPDIASVNSGPCQIIHQPTSGIRRSVWKKNRKFSTEVMNIKILRAQKNFDALNVFELFSSKKYFFIFGFFLWTTN